MGKVFGKYRFEKTSSLVADPLLIQDGIRE